MNKFNKQNLGFVSKERQKVFLKDVKDLLIQYRNMEIIRLKHIIETARKQGIIVEDTLNKCKDNNKNNKDNKNNNKRNIDV